MIQKSHRQWFFFLIVVIIIVFSITLFLFLRKPFLRDIQPRQARPGDTIVVEGQFFGRQGPRNTLSVGNQQITASHILLWKPSQISFRVPDGMRSGDIVVVNNRNKSNPVLLTNINTIPRPQVEAVQFNIDAQLIEGQHDSYWELTGNRNLPYFDFFLDGRKIPSAHRFPISENRVGLYIPAARLTTNGENVSGDLLLSRIEHAAKNLNVYNETFVIKSRNTSVLFDSTASAAASAGNPAGQVLYTLRVNFTTPEGVVPADYQELVLQLPLPDIDALSFTIESSFRGWVQLLPFTENHARIRLFPYNRALGSIVLNVHGSIPRQEVSDELLRADDDYAPGGLLLPIYSDYLEPANEPILDQEQRASLNAAIDRNSAALPLVREMYDWFSEQNLFNAAEALVDELRQRDIPARMRTGYVITDDSARFRTTSWAEFFLPRRGWISLYRESMHEGLGFAEPAHSYVPLPMGAPFPSIRNASGAALPQLIRSSVTPGELSESPRRL